MFKKVCCLLFVAVMLCGAALAVAPPDVSGEAVLLVEVTTDTVVYEKNAHQRMFPASTTKIMTALLVLELGDLDDIVTVQQSALTPLEGRGGRIVLIDGEQITLRDLLTYMLVASGNDACNVLAQHIAGSINDFVGLMNERARELGCTDTHFTNTTGLHDDAHYTSAYDLYLTTKEAMKIPLFAEIVKMKQCIIPENNKRGEAVFTTTNNLLTKARFQEFFYADALGIKTGTTTPAGYCLVSGVQNGTLTYYTVILNAEENDLLYNSTIALFGYAKKNFSIQALINTTDPICEVPVALGKNVDKVVLVPKETIPALLPNDFDLSRVKVSYKLDRDELTAPIAAGDVLGKATFSYEGKEYGTVDLIAAENVDLSKSLYTVDKITQFLGSPTVKISLIVLGAALLFLIFCAIVLRGGKGKKRSKYGPGRYR